jgi:hypothetical protein
MTESVSHVAAAPADVVGPATASMLPNLSADAARAEINALKAGADLDFSRAYLDGGHMGHAAALQRMSRLHELAAGVTADPAAPAAPAGGPARDEAGRFASEADQVDQVDATPYAGLRLETLPADAPLEDMARANEDIRHVAAAIGAPADISAAGLRLLEQDAVARQGRSMSTDELDEFENHLQKMTGENYDKAVDKFESFIKKSGKRGEMLRRSVAASSPHTAAWTIAMMFHEGR